MALDPQRFRRLAPYLASLPQGLDSHPDCQAKGTLARSFVSEIKPEQVHGAGLPAPVEALLLAPPNNSRWVPEVLSWAGIYAVVDLLGLSDQAFQEWVARKNRELFTNPVMRVVMNFTSPGLALALSSAYWGVLHHGSRLTVVDSAGASGQVALDYPDRLFDERAARSLGVAFSVALELSRARHLSVTLESWTATRATWAARWA